MDLCLKSCLSQWIGSSHLASIKVHQPQSVHWMSVFGAFEPCKDNCSMFQHPSFLGLVGVLSYIHCCQTYFKINLSEEWWTLCLLFCCCCGLAGFPVEGWLCFFFSTVRHGWNSQRSQSPVVQGWWSISLWDSGSIFFWRVRGVQLGMGWPRWGLWLSLDFHSSGYPG